MTADEIRRLVAAARADYMARRIDGVGYYGRLLEIILGHEADWAEYAEREFTKVAGAEDTQPCNMTKSP